MKYIGAIALTCGLVLLFTGSYVSGGFVLAFSVLVLVVANRPKRPKDPAVSRDRTGGLDSLFGNG